MNAAIYRLYSLLVRADYGAIADMCDGRLSASDIAYAVNEYGRKLVSYPKNVELDVIVVQGSEPTEYSVVAPIFTEEEGLSDLSLELSLVENSSGQWKVILDNIRVR